MSTTAVPSTDPITYDDLPQRSTKKRRGSRSDWNNLHSDYINTIGTGTQPHEQTDEQKSQIAAFTQQNEIDDSNDENKEWQMPTRNYIYKQENTIKNYEYLDHTADVQFHAWGDTLKQALEQVTICMFSYMTDLRCVDITTDFELSIEAHDLDSLLFTLLDEFLFYFATEEIICKKIEILGLDLQNFKIKAKGYGERFDLEKHPQGTEIKAITYSNMQIHINNPTDSTLLKHTDETMTKETDESKQTQNAGKHGADIYVIVDI